MKQLVFTIYGLISLLHIYIVHNIMLILCLVLIFELVRLAAFLQKNKIVLIVLSIFSIVFISINYNSMYKNNVLKQEINQAQAKTINNYLNKYWVSQDKFEKLLVESKENVPELPSKWLVVLLITLIELSLVYIVVSLPEKVVSNNGYRLETGKYMLDGQELSRTSYYRKRRELGYGK